MRKMERSRRIDGPSIIYYSRHSVNLARHTKKIQSRSSKKYKSIFCFRPAPILRKVASSETQQHFRKKIPANPSKSQPKMSHRAILSDLVIWAIAHNWIWASNVRFLKNSSGKFSYIRAAHIARTENSENPHFEVQKTFLKSFVFFLIFRIRRDLVEQMVPVYFKMVRLQFWEKLEAAKGSDKSEISRIFDGL